MMKTYKHKTNGSTMTFKDGCMRIENLVIEGTPNLDYWEEVVEKDYEVLRYTKKDGVRTNTLAWVFDKENWYEQSVRRLSDNEIFTIGDKVKETITGECKNWTISEFSFKDSRCFSAGVNINNIEKVNKEFLFTSDDGEFIFEGDIYYIPQRDGKSYKGVLEFKACISDLAITESKRFKSKEKALEYINKPLFTSVDGKDICIGQKFYAVDSKYFKLIETSGGSFQNERWKNHRYANKENALDYIALNKPCLSVKDITSNVNLGDMEIDRLKNLILSKSNL